MVHPWNSMMDTLRETKVKERIRRSSTEEVGWRSRTTPEAEVEPHPIELGIDAEGERSRGRGGATSEGG
jgi:hypothetical protein